MSAIALDTALLGVIAPLLPEIERRTSAGEVELGLALGAYSVPIVLLSIRFGRLADSRGRRPLLLAGLALTAVGSLVIAVPASLELLLVGRVIQGVGSSASWIAALALIGDLAPPDRKGEMIGYGLAANSVGAIGGPAIGGVLGGGIGFAAPFLVLAALALVIVAAGWRILPRAAGSPRSAGAPARVLRRAFTGPAIGATGISIGGALAIGMLEVVVPLDVDERLGFSAVAIGALFAGVAAIGALAAPIAGGRGDRGGRRPVAIVGLALLAASALPLVLVGGVLGVSIGLALFGIGSSTTFAAAVPWLDDAFGAFDRGAAYGGLNVLYALGYAIGPLLAGALLQLSGPEFAYGSLGVAMAVGATAIALQGRAGDGPRR